MSLVLSWILAYGYGFLLLASMLENTVLIGLAIPGDAIAVLGGAACARNILQVVPAFCATALGVLAGSVVSYVIGVRGGLPIVERWGGRFGLGAEKVAAVQHYFAKHGARTVFVGCFLSGIKNLVPAVAGAARMRFGAFLVYSATATVLRTALLVGVGYAFGAGVNRALELVRQMDMWAIGLFALIALGWLGGSWVKRRRGAKRAGSRLDS